MSKVVAYRVVKRKPGAANSATAPTKAAISSTTSKVANPSIAHETSSKRVSEVVTTNGKHVPACDLDPSKEEQMQIDDRSAKRGKGREGNSQSNADLPRSRRIYLTWQRMPGERFMHKARPRGTRTPNGLMWGHTLGDFFWVNRFAPEKSGEPPLAAVRTVWSRSMLKEWGEGYDETAFEGPEPPPRRRRPWPVLRVPKRRMERDRSTPLLGVIDEGCDNKDGRVKFYKIRPDILEESDEEDALRGCNEDEDEEPMMVPVDPNNPAHGFPYSELWAPHIRDAFTIRDALLTIDPQFMIKRSGVADLSREQQKAGAVVAAVIEDKRPEDDVYAAMERNVVKLEFEDEEAQGPLPEPFIPKSLPHESFFEPSVVAQLPKLEEFIPEQYFPDELRVFRKGKDAVTFKRILPQFKRDATPDALSPRVGQLWMSDSMVGFGSHSKVIRAPLALPPPLTAYGPHHKVTVAAKTARGLASARNHLRNEAHIFAGFPRHLQEEWCGYNHVPPIKHPVPVGAVVPKFFGYYVPVDSDGQAVDRLYYNYDVRVSGLSPILLMEECGTPIEPENFSLDDRSECYSLILRLHIEDILHNSLYTRNILWQPGPLTKPPEQRSRRTPSFRIIDFGRSENIEGEDMLRSKRFSFITERGSAQKQLLIEEFDY
ncbi:hypothetical protein WOLCODRAFT_137154 [Wolfiporia cocos MD-104 SS10]|uniref:Protein kinase domain-containing protein n=1 Tax=Wolfiporia cocos (strain MD-104) TaxID=742152 RepID=A0A2H3JQF9_WOLCO|nr:hypothetical protein WOLCODRAFT_137154 [Wolfiporia cocos MD-104 SS10]